MAIGYKKNESFLLSNDTENPESIIKGSNYFYSLSFTLYVQLVVMER